MGKINTPTPKQPKAVQVRVLVPWMIVTVFLATSFGVIAGWHLHVNVTADAHASVVSMSKDLR